MAGLGDTVTELLARARDMSAGGMSAGTVPGDLATVADFGPNPGGLGMRLHVPQALSPRSPLVVVLHGCGQTAGGYAAGAGWLELADRYGFAVLCPEQARSNNANLCFNWFEDGDVRRGAGEAASIAQMVRHASAELDLDPRRVFVTGLSAGGAMAAAMLAAYPDLFAAGAVVAGLPYGAAVGVGQALAVMRRVPEMSAGAWGDRVRAASPAPERRPRVAIWHGDADTTVAPGAAEALVLQWCDVHGSPRRVVEPPPAAGRTHSTWRRPDGEVVVELHRIAGLGHGTPIAAAGVDGCGKAGPWILEAGVSSSLEIARSWGVAGIRRPTAAPEPARSGPAAAGAASPAGDVGETISRALRKAGLLR